MAFENSALPSHEENDIIKCNISQKAIIFLQHFSHKCILSDL